jgi:hypothetical protein
MDFGTAIRFFAANGSSEVESLVSIDVRTEPGFTFSSPTKLPIDNMLCCVRPYDITPDGKQFVVTLSASEDANQPVQMRITLHWFEELKQRVPVQ